MTTESPFLLAREVVERVRLCKSTVYRQIQAGEFPPPVQLGARSVAWRLSDIQDWERSRVTTKVGGA